VGAKRRGKRRREIPSNTKPGGGRTEGSPGEQGFDGKKNFRGRGKKLKTTKNKRKKTIWGTNGRRSVHLPSRKKTPKKTKIGGEGKKGEYYPPGNAPRAT